MKFLPHSTLSLFLLLLFISCEFDKTELAKDTICANNGMTLPPAGFVMDDISSIPTSGGKILLMQFLDNKTGFALGRTYAYADAKCFKTINGGKLWTRLTFNTPHVPRGMMFFDKVTGIITLEDPNAFPPDPVPCIILRTQDGGDHWEEYFVPALSGSLSQLQLDSAGNVYGLLKNNFDAILMKSEDRGLTWESVEAAEQLNLVDDLLKIVNDRIYVVNRDEVILSLDIDGNLINEMNTGGILPVDFEILDDDHFIICGDNGIIRSDDGGDTWETIYEREARLIGFSSFDRGVAILNKFNCPADLYAANDVIASTTDGGRTWIESEYSTNILQDFVLSEQIGSDSYVLLISKWLYELKSN